MVSLIPVSQWFTSRTEHKFKHVAEFCVKLSLVLTLNILPVFIANLVPVSVGRGKFALKVHKVQKAGY